MENLLSTLQALQTTAFKKGIHTFQLAVRNCDDGVRAINICIFLTGNDTDDDFHSFDFYTFYSAIENLRELNNLKAFIGEE